VKLAREKIRIDVEAGTRTFCAAFVLDFIRFPEWVNRSGKRRHPVEYLLNEVHGEQVR
jgi:hypothetical protein